MKQPLFIVCLLPLGFTISHPSDRGIRRKEFSKLKLLKTYLRSQIKQKRQNSLAIMSIESEISRDLNLDKILNDIANARATKNKFLLQMRFLYRRLDSLKHGCGAKTEISGSSSGCRHLKFLARTSTPTTKWFAPLKTIVLFVQLYYYASVDEVSRNDIFDG